MELQPHTIWERNQQAIDTGGGGGDVNESNRSMY